MVRYLIDRMEREEKPSQMIRTDGQVKQLTKPWVNNGGTVMSWFTLSYPFKYQETNENNILENCYCSPCCGDLLPIICAFPEWKHFFGSIRLESLSNTNYFPWKKEVESYCVLFVIRHLLRNIFRLWISTQKNSERSLCFCVVSFADGSYFNENYRLSPNLISFGNEEDL